MSSAKPIPFSLILPAGGKGVRFGSETPKQFLEIAGHPLLFYTLLAVRKVAGLKEIILVLPPGALADFTAAHGESLARLGVTRIVQGGERRQDSVLAGIRAASPEIEWVAVHDAVRPLVTPAEIEATLRSAFETGGAILAQKSSATVKRVNDKGVIQETLDRRFIYLAQTPQAGRRDLLTSALANCPKEMEYTDEAKAFETLGIQVKVVDGSPLNVKITTPEDLQMAAPLLSARIAELEALLHTPRRER